MPFAPSFGQARLENASSQPLTSQSGHVPVYPLIECPDWLPALDNRPRVLVTRVPYGPPTQISRVLLDLDLHHLRNSRLPETTAHLGTGLVPRLPSPS